LKEPHKNKGKKISSAALCPVLEDGLEHKRVGSSERQRHSCVLEFPSSVWRKNLPSGSSFYLCLYCVTPFAMTSSDKNNLKETS